jgi:hypothetical protein
MTVDLNKAFIFNNTNNFGNKITLNELMKKRWRPFIGETITYPIALQGGANIVKLPGGVVLLRATPLNNEEINSNSYLKYNTKDFVELSKALYGSSFNEEVFLLPRKYGVEVNNAQNVGNFDFDPTEVMISHAPTSIELATTSSPDPAGINALPVTTTKGLKWYKKAFNSSISTMNNNMSLYPNPPKLLNIIKDLGGFYFWSPSVRGGGFTPADWADGYWWKTFNSSGEDLTLLRYTLTTDTSSSSGVSNVIYQNLQSGETININQFEPANFKGVAYICAGVV